MVHTDNRFTRRQCLQLLAGVAATALAPGAGHGEAGRTLLRLAVSTDTLAGVNIDDARASYIALINEYNMGHARTVSAEVVAGVFIPSAELQRDIRQGTVDCFGVTAIEYAQLADIADPQYLVLQDYLADGIEYLLLVHDSSTFRKIADLQGAQILIHRHRDMVLAQAWLSTLLATDRLPQPEGFFASISPRDNVTQTVLPVFFRRADGACVTRPSWETAVELNPQLGRELRPLAVSPKVIPTAIGFRRNCNPTGRKLLLDSMLNMTTTAAGRQMAALYQARSFVQRPASVMAGSVEMVRQSERLTKQQTGSRKGHS